MVECRAAQLRVDRRHEELHQAYEAGRIVKTLMAFFLKWFAEERQARLDLFIWDCISSRRNARKVPLCRRGLTVKKHPEHAARCVGVGVPWHARGAPKSTCPCV